MNHAVGLNIVLSRSDSIKNIFFNIDSNNHSMKAQLLELLAALSVYSDDGYKYEHMNFLRIF